VVVENEFFAVLGNPGSLAPGFLARDFVILPPDSYAMAPAVLQLTAKNIITVEMPGVDPSLPGFAGQAKSQNQVELLPKYQTEAGAPFARFPADGVSATDGQSLTFRLPGNASGWLVSTMTYHPDWKASVDGQVAQIRRADGALMAVAVPTGAREVTFRFAPPSWYSFCLGLAALSWIAVLAVLVSLRFGWAPARGR
jgi:hypothetical protein